MPLDVFQESTQRTVTLHHRLASGGEADIYEDPEDPSRVLKILKHPTPERGKKLRAMTAAAPTSPPLNGGTAQFLSPTAIVTDPADLSRVLGYQMLRARNYTSLVRVCNPALKAPQSDHAFRLRVARNLCWGLAALHDQGIVVGDLYPSNILVGPQGEAWFVDCDSFQIRSGSECYYCLAGRPEFTPAELHGAPFDKVAREPCHDNFALGVILFMLLTDGSHPFSAWYNASGQRMPLHERIRNGFWPHAANRTHPYEPRRPSLPLYCSLDPKITPLMEQCFDAGHVDPSKRPSAREWHVVLDVILSTKPYRKNLPSCSRRRRRSFSPRMTPIGYGFSLMQRLATYRNPITIIASLLLGVTLGMAVDYWLDRWNQAPDHSTGPTQEETSAGKPTPQLWKDLAEGRR